MALPAKVSTSNLRLGSDNNAGDSGPWYWEDWVHGLFFDLSSNKVQVWGDQAPNRGENFAELHSAGSPAGHTNTNLNKPVGVIRGEMIWAIYPDASANLKASGFSRGKNEWTRAITSSLARVEPTGATLVGGGLTAVALPGERLRVIHNSTKVSTKDTVYWVDLDLNAGTFGSQSILHSGSGSANFVVRSALVGVGGLTHVFYIDDASPRNLYHRSIAPDGTLGTEQTVVTGVRWDIGDVAFESGVVKLAVPYAKVVPSQVYHSLHAARADSEADPTWTLDDVSSDPVLYTEAFFGAAFASCAWVNGKIHYCHEGSAISDLPPSAVNLNNYRRVFSGGSWGSSIVLDDPSTTFSLTPRVRRSDNGLGVFLVKGPSGDGEYYYTEVPIDPCPTGDVPRYFARFRRVGRG